MRAARVAHHKLSKFCIVNGLAVDSFDVLCLITSTNIVDVKCIVCLVKCSIIGVSVIVITKVDREIVTVIGNYLSLCNLYFVILCLYLHLL